jgi:hypothetical protein
MTTADSPRKVGDERPRPGGALGSRVVALASALLLGFVCFLLGLFALWPPMPGEDRGLAQALTEVLLLGVAGMGTATALRWALGAHGRSAVVLGTLLGLTPCLLVTVELLRR